jgi:peptide/nickel transport system permease protein
MFRVVRASSLSFANRDFVIAARTMGATTPRILFREILPNVVPVAVTFGLITVAGVIVLEGSLAFLGLSVPPPTPSWGNMISEGTANGNLSINPYIMLWPAAAMFLLLLSINLIGDRMRQRFDIREGLL